MAHSQRDAGLAAGIFAVATLFGAAGVQAASTLPHLVAHRAVYDMRLDSARTSSGIEGLSGRMVFEFRGSTCEGFTQNMRFVTRTTDGNGKSTISDMRTSSWEEGAGGVFRFNSTTLRNDKISERSSGKARRVEGEELSVNITKPKADVVAFKVSALFPVQHTRELLATAEAGKRILQANIYDGSDQGTKIYNTTAFVGNRIAPGAKPPGGAVVNGGRLSGLASWPVSISYYDLSKNNAEGVPSYQMAFRFFSNGVARALKIDYGTFALEGRLTELEFLKPSVCEAE